jgi:hypothetical protein
MVATWIGKPERRRSNDDLPARERPTRHFSLQRLASLIQALRGRFDINDFE